MIYEYEEKHCKKIRPAKKESGENDTSIPCKTADRGTVGTAAGITREDNICEKSINIKADELATANIEILKPTIRKLLERKKYKYAFYVFVMGLNRLESAEKKDLVDYYKNYIFDKYSNG
jgi:hypothetical protein